VRGAPLDSGQEEQIQVTFEGLSIHTL
jgi:hypothetical protein